MTVTYTKGENGTLQDTTGNDIETDGIGVTVAAWDTTKLTISSAALDISNSYIDITFDEGVYGANDGTTVLTAAKLVLSFSQNTGTATNVAISSIKKNDETAVGSASDLTGGETVVRVFLTVTGTPNGAETIEIKPADDASVYDMAGNAALATQTTGVKSLNDKTAPTVSNLSPAYDSTDVSRTSNLVISFNENISVVTGNVTINKAYDESVVEVIDITGEKVTGTGTSTITINPSTTLDPATEYYVLIDATAIDDTAGNSFTGIASNAAWNFTTVSLSNNADLSALTLSNGTLTPVFNSATTNYEASVSNETSSITVTSTAADSNASVMVNEVQVTSGQASGEVNLNVGANTVTIVVTAEDTFT